MTGPAPSPITPTGPVPTAPTPLGELTAADLESYTKGRLPKGDPETQRVLSAALVKVRRYCKWHVTPVTQLEAVTLNGPGDWGGWGIGSGALYGGPYYAPGAGLHRVRVGGQVLFLPTKRLLGITSMVEDGNAVDLTTLQWTEHGEVIKTTHIRWSVNFQGLQVTFTHGYTPAEAADWQQIVLAIADRMSLVRGLTGGPFDVMVGPYRISEHSPDVDPYTDLLDQIDVAAYVRMEV